MSDRLKWDISNDDDLTVAKLAGPVNEDADFAPLVSELSAHTKVRFELSGVDRINSCGVREWVNFIRALPESSHLELEKCTPAVVSQLNMISNFAGSARIVSVFAPYVCDGCGEEVNILVELHDSEVPQLEEHPCPSCGEVMEFDDVEDSYFAFLL